VEAVDGMVIGAGVANLVFGFAVLLVVVYGIYESIPASLAM
jgi:hypothetical protein